MQQYCGNFFLKFDLEMEQIKNSNISPICKAKLALNFIEEKLKGLFSWLENYHFKSDEEEIRFFKEIKIKITSKFIFYKNLLDIESQLPSSSKKLRLKHYETALNKCYQVFKEDKEFLKYYRSGCCHNDHLYFIRNTDIQIINKDINIINFDKKVCTSHDLKVANIIANDILVLYLEEKIEEIKNKHHKNNLSIKSNVNWTGTKIEIVELIYALHSQKMFNGGNTDIKEIAKLFGKTFNIELDESIYRCFQDIKNRKNVKAKYLYNLFENFNNKMIEEELLAPTVIGSKKTSYTK